MGIGMALMEEYLPGRTANLHDYLIPTIGDVPEIVPILIEKPDPEGPSGARGLGEHTLIPTAPAILNAIRHATGAEHRPPPRPPRPRPRRDPPREARTMTPAPRETPRISYRLANLESGRVRANRRHTSEETMRAPRAPCGRKGRPRAASRVPAARAAR